MCAWLKGCKEKKGLCRNQSQRPPCRDPLLRSPPLNENPPTHRELVPHRGRPHLLPPDDARDVLGLALQVSEGLAERRTWWEQLSRPPAALHPSFPRAKGTWEQALGMGCPQEARLSPRGRSRSWAGWGCHTRESLGLPCSTCSTARAPPAPKIPKSRHWYLLECRSLGAPRLELQDGLVGHLDGRAVLPSPPGAGAGQALQSLRSAPSFPALPSIPGTPQSRPDQPCSIPPAGWGCQNRELSLDLARSPPSLLLAREKALGKAFLRDEAQGELRIDAGCSNIPTLRWLLAKSSGQKPAWHL